MRKQALQEITSFAVTASFIDIFPDGAVSMMAMWYISKLDGRASMRHGTEKRNNGETVMMTLKRLIMEEIAGGKKGDFRYTPLSPKPINLALMNDEKHPGGLHLKVAYALKKTAGEFRTRTHHDDDEDVYPPKMYEIRELIGLTGRKTPKFHFGTTIGGLYLASDLCENTYWMYEELKANHVNPMENLSSYHQAILGRFKEWE